MDIQTSEDVDEEYKVLKVMICNIYVGEPKGLSAVEALERAKTDVMNQAQIGFVKGAVQSAINDSISNLNVWRY